MAEPGCFGVTHLWLMSLREEASERPEYLLKMRGPRRARATQCEVLGDAWQYCSTPQTCKVAEGLIQFTVWTAPSGRFCLQTARRDPRI